MWIAGPDYCFAVNSWLVGLGIAGDAVVACGSCCGVRRACFSCVPGAFVARIVFLLLLVVSSQKQEKGTLPRCSHAWPHLLLGNTMVTWCEVESTHSLTVY